MYEWLLDESNWAKEYHAYYLFTTEKVKNMERKGVWAFFFFLKTYVELLKDYVVESTETE